LPTGTKIVTGRTSPKLEPWEVRKKIEKLLDVIMFEHEKMDNFTFYFTSWLNLFLILPRLQPYYIIAPKLGVNIQ